MEQKFEDNACAPRTENSQIDPRRVLKKAGILTDIDDRIDTSQLRESSGFTPLFPVTSNGCYPLKPLD